MSPKFPSQNRTLHSFFTPVPKKNATLSQPASSSPAPPTIQETPTLNSTAILNQTSHSSPSPSPVTPSIPAPSHAVSGDTSLPQSSGNSTTASKRRFSHGQPVVLNSDSDSDELSDLDVLFDKPVHKPKAIEPQITWRTRERNNDNVLRQPPKRRKDDKAFRAFVQNAQKNAEIERQIAEVQADLDKPVEKDFPERNGMISEELVANAVHDDDDPEKAKKLYLAMQRTNALHADCVFHFFDSKPSGATLSSPSFPLDTLPHHKWTAIFKDSSSRDQAFLTGFAQQIFRQELSEHAQKTQDSQHRSQRKLLVDLPGELAAWIVDQVCIGSSEALDQRYLQLLSDHQHHLGEVLDESKLETIFRNIGAKPHHLDSNSDIEPSFELDPRSRPLLPKSLTNICKLLQLVAPRLRSGTRIRVLQNLSIICMDDRVQANNVVLYTLRDTIESLIHPITNNKELVLVLDSLLSNLLLRIKHPILQRNLITAFPNRSPLTASIQRYLALSFLVYPTRVFQPLGSPEVLDLIYKLLRTSPHFQITKDSSYAVLAARFTLLDMAIGPGPSAVPYIPLLSSPTSQDSQGQSLLSALMPSQTEQKTFNKEVDALVVRIRLIGNSINIAEAITDLTRLEANHCCNRLCTRLEHAVRLGGRKVKDVFAREDEEIEYAKATFKRFFKPKNTESGIQTPASNEGVSGVAAGNGEGEVRMTDRATDNKLEDAASQKAVNTARTSAGGEMPRSK